MLMAVSPKPQTLSVPYSITPFLRLESLKLLESHPTQIDFCEKFDGGVKQMN